MSNVMRYWSWFPTVNAKIIQTLELEVFNANAKFQASIPTSKRDVKEFVPELYHAMISYVSKKKNLRKHITHKA